MLEENFNNRYSCIHITKLAKKQIKDKSSKAEHKLIKQDNVNKIG